MAVYMPNRAMETLEWLEHRGCKTKRDFSSKSIAKEECKKIKKYHGNKFYPYECQFCGKWHLSRRRPRDE